MISHLFVYASIDQDVFCEMFCIHAQCRKLNLLSFGEEAEEEENELAAVKKKIMSSHDVLDDPRLLKEATPNDELVCLLPMVSPYFKRIKCSGAHFCFFRSKLHLSMS